jgi:hypothetical protein
VSPPEKDQRAGQFGCEKAGHPQNYSHDCDDWDDATEWIESTRAGTDVSDDAWIETVIDAIPPKKWDVFIWLDGGGSREGRIDGADQRSLVRTIVTAYMDEIIGPPATTEDLREAIMQTWPIGSRVKVSGVAHHEGDVGTVVGRASQVGMDVDVNLDGHGPTAFRNWELSGADLSSTHAPTDSSAIGPERST